MPETTNTIDPAALRQQVGLPADASDDDVTAKLKELNARPTAETASKSSASRAKKAGLPKTKTYRVRIAGAIYDRFVETVNDDGEDAIAKVRELATFGQEIELTDREARRLTALNAVKPADEPLSYDEMDDKTLDAEVKKVGIEVRSSGADADKPLRTDKINALVIYDQGRGVGQPVVPARAA